jgi:hypothetical protein
LRCSITTPSPRKQKSSNDDFLTIPPPASASRFEFHSDTKAPIQLSKLEQKTAQSITSFRQKLNGVDKKIASWYTKYSKEVVDRDSDLIGMLDFVCIDPLERANERFHRRLNDTIETAWGYDDKDGNGSNDFGDIDGHGEDDQSNNEKEDDSYDGETLTHRDNDKENIDSSVDRQQQPQRRQPTENHKDNQYENDQGKKSKKSSIKSLLEEISTLSSQLNQHIHISLPTSMKENIHDFQAKYQNQIPSHLQIEKMKATKREQSICQKFESMAGMTSKSLAEEKATSHAELTILKEKVLEAGGWDELRTSRFLEEIKDIRKLLQREREERKVEDEIVFKKIVETRDLLQHTLLESISNYD